MLVAWLIVEHYVADKHGAAAMKLKYNSTVWKQVVVSQLKYKLLAHFGVSICFYYKQIYDLF